MNRNISKVAVLGSGVMGSQIACHFANIGVEVLLLDIPPKAPGENAAGTDTSSPKFKNKLVTDSFEAAVKTKPSPLYATSFRSRITLGNFDDNLQDIKDYDWVIEVVVENLEIKKQLFDKVEKFRKPATLITSNTSG